ncbi:hypothetical protein C8J31_101804 [Rhizobium sp. PP-CC-2G-626]|nr:hypothetical protein C8J31_101804 [Rhizobium sp. PP-CC-2G-626]
MRKIPFERILLFILGAIFLIVAATRAYDDRLAQAGTVGLLGLMCLAFSNLTRFKRFKGMGFEAELWEEKQEEALSLIERLKNVVAIYSSEVVLANVKRGRFGGGAPWPQHWKLYEELIGHHKALGQDIDFSALKREMDGYFLFDICSKLDPWHPISTGITEARAVISEEFSGGIQDTKAFEKRMKQLNDIKTRPDNQLEQSLSGNLAQIILDTSRQSVEQLRTNFGVEVSLPADQIEVLERVAALAEKRPLAITPDVLKLAEN